MSDLSFNFSEIEKNEEFLKDFYLNEKGNDVQIKSLNACMYVFISCSKSMSTFIYFFEKKSEKFFFKSMANVDLFPVAIMEAKVKESDQEKSIIYLAGKIKNSLVKKVIKIDFSNSINKIKTSVAIKNDAEFLPKDFIEMIEDIFINNSKRKSELEKLN
ncbi:MAG: hypothetical protein KBD12_02775 [Candidatus Pacebacteria bacterium]|nr:hypothetical protein [Candidatus Paceibacterota bacterium]